MFTISLNKAENNPRPQGSASGYQRQPAQGQIDKAVKDFSECLKACV